MAHGPWVASGGPHQLRRQTSPSPSAVPRARPKPAGDAQHRSQSESGPSRAISRPPSHSSPPSIARRPSPTPRPSPSPSVRPCVRKSSQDVPGSEREQEITARRTDAHVVSKRIPPPALSPGPSSPYTATVRPRLLIRTRPESLIPDRRSHPLPPAPVTCFSPQRFPIHPVSPQNASGCCVLDVLRSRSSPSTAPARPSTAFRTARSEPGCRRDRSVCQPRRRLATCQIFRGGHPCLRLVRRARVQRMNAHYTRSSPAPFLFPFSNARGGRYSL